MYMLKFYNISERFKQEINESKYKRWILENKGMLLISILIAIFLTILTYPGIMYSDSYARIGVTSELKTAIHAFNVGNVSMTNLASWLTITPSFFILLSEQIVGSVVLYTFVQCFLLFLSTYIMGDGLRLKTSSTINCKYLITMVRIPKSPKNATERNRTVVVHPATGFAVA